MVTKQRSNFKQGCEFGPELLGRRGPGEGIFAAWERNAAYSGFARTQDSLNAACFMLLPPATK